MSKSNQRRRTEICEPDGMRDTVFKKNAAAGQQERNSGPAVDDGLPLFTGELVAWAMPLRNRSLLVAFIPGSDPKNPLNLVSVRVRDNVNFLKGMKIPGPGRRLDRVSEKVFDLMGECPRWRGRW